MEIISGPYSWDKYKSRKPLISSALAKIIICLLTVVIFLAFIRNEKQSWRTLISPVLSSHNLSLEKTVEEALDSSKGSYGVVIKNLKNEESYYLNEHKEFEAGSLYKLWIMAEAFRQIQEGQLTEDEILSKDIAYLNKVFNIPSDSAELTDGEITLSVKNALNQMITISHNYAALLLTEKLKLSSVAAFLKDKGLSESRVGTDGSVPISTPSDIALYFEKLYKGELVSSQKMSDLLKAQQLNNKLPKYLPKEVAVAHKTGEIGYFTHDAGLVFTPKGDYIIVVLSESNFPSGSEERIAKISQSVYDYFTK